MELTVFTDYGLRVLMYLAKEDHRHSSIDELSDFFGLSRHHVAKITSHLAKAGYLETARGKNGGVSLAQAPKSINIADVIQSTEPHLNIVECFAGDTSGCRLHNCCRLKSILFEARAEFFKTLGKYTLEDAASGNWSRITGATHRSG